MYMDGWSIEDIAKILKVSTKTISTWAKARNWKAKRTSIGLMKDNSYVNLMEIFDYQVQALKSIKDEHIAKGEMIPFSTGDFDALQKLHTTIKRDHRKFNDYVEIMKDFIDFAKEIDLELAQKMTYLADKFINEKHKQIS